MLKGRVGTNFDQVIHRLLPWVARVRVHPDVLSLGGVVIACGAGVAFATEHERWAGLILIAAGACDLLDGAVARSQGTTSSAGAFFDSSLDRVGELVAFGGIAWALAARGDPFGVILTVWALGASFITSYARARAETRLARLDVGWMERAERFGILILGALLGQVEIALWIIAIGATATSVQRFVVARRLLREFDRTGRDPTASADPAAAQVPQARSGTGA